MNTRNKRKAPGPEVLTIKGSTVRIYSAVRQKKGAKYQSFVLAYVANGTRQRKTFATRDAARAAAKAIADQLSRGTAHAAALTPAEATDARSALRNLRPIPGMNLSRAVAEWLQIREKLKGIDVHPLTAIDEWLEHRRDNSELVPGTVSEVFEVFMTHLKKEGASHRYVSDCRSRMGRFAKAFRVPIASVRATEVVAWIDSLKVSKRTQKNFRTAIATLLSFARDRGHLHRDKKTEIEALPKTRRLKAAKLSAPVQIYTPEELARILTAASPEIAALVATQAFAGLRSTELARLRWRDIKPTSIEVPAANSKTAQRRLAPRLPALDAWLAKIAPGNPDDHLHPWKKEDALSEHIARAVRTAGVTPRHNGLRHSFCSYRMAATMNTAQVALEAGNSPQILFQHYREIVTADDAKQWFNIMPERPKNVLPLPRKSGAGIKIGAAC